MLSKSRQLWSLWRITDKMLQEEGIANAANSSIQKSGVTELRISSSFPLHIDIVIAHHPPWYFIIQKPRCLN